MIPIQIALEGFLSYREQQVINLSDMSLCMLSGPNGSGKSSVFDAMTVALFNMHRGGKSGREDLINKKCDSATIEFDFELRGIRWQARRTLSRSGNPTQDIRRWSEAKDGWEIVPGTSASRGYAEWITANVGVSAETFTSSMLLRQGQADRLLTAAPKQRAELLSTVIGLDQYKALHERVLDQRKSRKQRLDSLERELGLMPQVSDEQLASADSDVTAAQLEVDAAESNVERLMPLQAQSQQWTWTQTAIKSAEAEQRELDGLLSRAADIERDAARLRELQGVLPVIQHLLDTREQRDNSAANVQELTSRQKAQLAAQAELKTEIDAAEESQVAATNEAQNRETKSHEIALRIAELTPILSQADTLARQRDQLERFRADLTKLPANPTLDCEIAREEARRLSELSEGSAWIRQLAKNRQAIRDGQEQYDAQQQNIERLQAELGKIADELQALQRDQAAAERSCDAARDQDAIAQAELKQARAALQSFEKANGQAECPTCGHELTTEHLAAEQSRRRALEAEAIKVRGAAAATFQESQQDVDRLARRRKELDRQHTQFDSSHQQAIRDSRNLSDEVDKAVKQCREAYSSLSQSYRGRVGNIPQVATSTPADWLPTVWPTQEDLAVIKTDLDSLPSAKERAAQCEKIFRTWTTVSTQITMLENSLADQPNEDDFVSYRAEHASLIADKATLIPLLDDDKERAKKLKEDLEALQKKFEDDRLELSKLATQLAAETTRIGAHEDTIARCLKDLRGNWTATTIDGPLVKQLGLEQQRLTEANIEAQEQLLHEARSQANSIAVQIELLQKQAESIPADARCDPSLIDAQLKAARERRAKFLQEKQTAEMAFKQLQTAKVARVDKDEQRKVVAREHSHYDVLSELLGRDGLQRHLMREAEQAIVKYANDILAPISGGDLLLRQRNADGATDDDALDLEAFHTRISNADAIATCFLSGSQQFRVAVALALAIGQYAGGGNRLGECVIIDEGFGSLDTQGQEVMIEELQRLRGIMKRIILVSHQESFAAAFPAGYRFTLADGETRVSRITG